MDNTRFSTVTFISSSFTPRTSVRMQYSLPSPVLPTKGAHSVTVIVSSWPSPRRNDEVLNNEDSRSCKSLISLKGSQLFSGSHLVNPVITISSFLSGLGSITAGRHPLAHRPDCFRNSDRVRPLMAERRQSTLFLVERIVPAHSRRRSFFQLLVKCRFRTIELHDDPLSG